MQRVGQSSRNEPHVHEAKRRGSKRTLFQEAGKSADSRKGWLLGGQTVSELSQNLEQCSVHHKSSQMHVNATGIWAHSRNGAWRRRGERNLVPSGTIIKHYRWLVVEGAACKLATLQTCCSQFRRLKVQEQDASMNGFLGRPSFGWQTADF